MNDQFIASKRGTFFLMMCTLFALFLSPVALIAQTSYQSTGGVKIVIEGTSNIHDWDMKSEKGISSAQFAFDAAGSLISVSNLSFTMPAESLKSEHSAMDKNTYKALNTSKYNSISFTAGSGTLRHTGGNAYVLTANGKLTISGVTRDAQLTSNCTLNGDKTVSCTGSYSLKMTDFKVTPPSIMFGAIKTGDAITVKFNLTLHSI